ncbi:MAG TPA: hypothetical protein VFW07_14235 [Parafilimonas sp.]|nr:hypothetical protein [Parafilimonas sp.]
MRKTQLFPALKPMPVREAIAGKDEVYSITFSTCLAQVSSIANASQQHKSKTITDDFRKGEWSCGAGVDNISKNNGRSFPSYIAFRDVFEEMKNKEATLLPSSIV